MSERSEELARIVAELAELVDALGEPGVALARRARQLADRLQSGDPARWAMGDQTVTVEVDVPARVVAETLANERTGAVIVMASGGPVGIVAERDLVMAVANRADLDRLSAVDLIATDLVAAEPGDTIAHVAALMARHRVRHLPVVEGGRLVGMISALDLLAVVGDTTD